MNPRSVGPTNKTRRLKSSRKEGVRLPMRGTPGPNKKRQADAVLNDTIKEYKDIGVLRQLSEKEANSTKYWVSTFGRQKHDSTDVRMITDLRPLNATLRAPPFRADHWAPWPTC